MDRADRPTALTVNIAGCTRNGWTWGMGDAGCIVVNRSGFLCGGPVLGSIDGGCVELQPPVPGFQNVLNFGKSFPSTRKRSLQR